MRSNLAVIRAYEPRLTIALGSRLKGRDSRNLTNRTGWWDSILSDVFSSTPLPFTRSQYLKKSEEERDQIKTNHPYFLGGSAKGRRGQENYLPKRSCIVLDIEKGAVDVVETLQTNLEKMELTALIHQTLNHSESNPRIRVVIPLMDEIDASDYGSCTRIVASKLLPGMDGVDPTCFKASQPMLLPSHCIDEEPVWIVTDGEFYNALRDLEEWKGEFPRTPAEGPARTRAFALSAVPRFPEGAEPSDVELAGNDWRGCLDVHPRNGKPLGNLKNVALILRNVYPDCIATNLLDRKVYVRKGFLGIKAGCPLTDEATIVIRHHLEAELELSQITQQNLDDALVLIAGDAEFHPIQEYLNQLEWDCDKRLDSWTARFGAEQTAYTREAGRLTLLAAVARAFEPGAKFDSVLVIVTPQGAGKGRLLKALGRQWYRELSSDFHDANRMTESTQGGWIVEFAELQGMGRADRNTLKSYITRTNDAGRLAYARNSEDRPRQFVVIGSSNEFDFLADETGERRWWPVGGTNCTADPIEVPSRQEIDQLWAEAVIEYRRMRAENPDGDLPLYLSKEARQEHAEVVGRFKALTEVDLLAQQVSAWIAECPVDEFTQGELWKGLGGKVIPTRAEATRLGNVMRRFEPEWIGRRETKFGQKITVYRRTLTGAEAGAHLPDNLMDNLYH